MASSRSRVAAGVGAGVLVGRAITAVGTGVFVGDGVTVGGGVLVAGATVGTAVGATVGSAVGAVVGTGVGSDPQAAINNIANATNITRPYCLFTLNPSPLSFPFKSVF